MGDTVELHELVFDWINKDPDLAERFMAVSSPEMAWAKYGIACGCSRWLIIIGEDQVGWNHGWTTTSDIEATRWRPKDYIKASDPDFFEKLKKVLIEEQAHCGGDRGHYTREKPWEIKSKQSDEQ
jgi:hypothetical protein